MYYRFLLILLNLLTFTETSAQFNEFFLSYNDDLNGRPVSDIKVDNDGYTWLGTYGSGVYRYDGIFYEHFERNWKDSTSLSSNFIRVLFQDNKGTLWTGTDNGLSFFNKNTRTFESYPLLSKEFPNRALTIYDIQDGVNDQLVFGSDIQGILILDKTTGETEILKSEDFSNQKNLSINKIVSANQRFFYLATGQGLFSLSLDHKEFKKVNFSFIPKQYLDVGLQSLYLDDEQNLWVGTSTNGLLYIDFKNQEYKHYPITKTRVMDITLNNNDLFIATENDGLYIIKNQDLHSKPIQIEKSNSEESLESNSIWSLEALPNNRVLLGYYQFGMGLYDPSFFKFRELKHKVNNGQKNFNSVNSISKIKDDLYWIGMDGTGLAQYSPSNEQYTLVNEGNKSKFRGFNSYAVQTTFIDSKKNLWVGTWDNGIYMLPNGSTHFHHYQKSNTNGTLKSNRVLAFTEDKSGNIWFGTFGSGVHYYNPKNKTFNHLQKGGFNIDHLYKKDIRSLIVDQNNFLWIGSTKGVYKVDISNLESLKVEAIEKTELFSVIKKKGDNILSLFEDHEQNIWLGTDGGGVYKYSSSNHTLQSFDKSNGLLQSVVCGIVEDDSYKIWLTGKSGVSSIDQATGVIDNFSKNEGLSSNNFNYNSIYFDNKIKELYVGNIVGLNALNPSSLKVPTEHNVIVNLKELKIFNKTMKVSDEKSPLEKPINETEVLTLQPNQSVFSLVYAGLDFPYSKRLKYAYYLEGLEQEWNYVGKKRVATYTSLPDGEYIFHVKAMSIDGKWSDEKTLQINVLPHWYQSSWAIFGYIISFLLGLGVLSYLMKIRLREKQAIKLERDRRIQEEEVSQTKLQFFTNISHEFRTPLTLILNPVTDLLKNGEINEDIRDKYASIYRNAMRLKQLIDELMDFRKLSFNKMKLKVQNVEVKEVVKEVILFFKEDAKNKGINLSVESPEVPIYTYLDVKMIEKILFNLLSNALKLTPQGGDIFVRIDQVELEGKEHLELSISDTGVGMTEEEVKNIFTRFYQVEKHQKAYYGGTGIGLEVVQEFVKLHHGSIKVESVENEGTTFKLYFPFGKEHFKKGEIYESDTLNRNKYLIPEKVMVNPTLETVRIDENEIDMNSTVLIVEDNYDLRKYLSKTLGKLYNVIVAEDGEIGLKKAKEEKVDIILSDVMMPNMDGFELCQKIKADIQTSHIPIILLTAKNTTTDRIKGIDLGADAYLQKPFDFDLLKVTLSQMMNSRRILLKKFVGGFTENKDFKNTTSVDKDFLQRISKHVYENISDPNLNVEVLAEKLNLSRSQLYRKIKSLTGVSATVFIRRIRLEEAKKLLKSGSANISEVCYAVGFSSPSYFTKCYREYFETLPTDDMKPETV